MRIFKTFRLKLSIISVLLALAISVWWVDAASIRAPADNYLVGVGISDVTGPAADVNMMGYTMLSQKVNGIHLRLRSRAYIVVDQNTGKRSVFASVDICMASTPVRRLTLTKLKEKFGDMYNDQNVAIAGTHTHAGPAGFLQYTSLHILSSGYIKENTETIASGIFASIVNAHESLQPGNIYVASGELVDANINRSPSAYDNNPQEEKDQYKANTDKEMVLLKFTTTDGKVLGSVNWFPVHCTSMYNNNTYISGDNKGYAGYLMEKTFNGPDTLPGTGSVHAFAQSNMGDVSPNTLGAFCEDTGEPCDYKTSTCNGKNELCQGRGPGWPIGDIESTRLIGERQAKKAMELLDSATTPVTGSVDYRHQFIKMSEYSFELNGKNVTLCKPAMGYSFAAGTTDGPGAFDFKQGDNSSGSPFWDFVKGAIKKPSAELVECQKPKPVLLATGEISFPYAWAPAIADVQMLKIGNFVIIAVPGEFTTMSGRRLRTAVKETLVANGVIGEDGIVVLAGPANEYTHYVTTFEEFAVQRYEGASTIYGPNTLNAYISIYKDLSKSFADGILPNPGDPPPDLTGKALTLLPGVVVDVPPIGKKFGDILQNVDANSTFTPGQQVSIQFVTGNPRNNHFRDDSFMYVQRLDESSGQWLNVRTDGDWSTRYSWLDNSKATVTWEIEPETVAGKYKIVYQGCNKLLTSVIEKHSGESSEFFVAKS